MAQLTQDTRPAQLRTPLGKDAGAARLEQHVHSWASDRKLRTGKVHFNDYDYLQPKKNLKAPKE